LIQIYEVPVHTDRVGALERQRNACQRVMCVITEVGKLGLQYTPIFLGCALKPVYEFLVREASCQEDEQRAVLIQMEIEMLSRIIEHVKRPMPF